MVVNNEKYKKNIIFGKIFMKKYQIIFNSNYKSISFYENNNFENDKDTFKTNKKRTILIVL